MLETILIVILVLFLLGALGTLPTWPHSRSWGIRPERRDGIDRLHRGPPDRSAAPETVLISNAESVIKR